ncbi:MAG: aspartate kinase [Thermoplasmata archaeon]|nr:aspartate kinase [Thermoplasmata archaeon]
MVVKFGGAALADPHAVVARVRDLRARHGSLVVVVSAREGVTNRLLTGLSAVRDERAVERTITWIRRQHPGIGGMGERQAAELGRALRGRERPSAERTDRLLAMGERWAAEWLVQTLQRGGVASTAIDAAELGLWTDGRYGAATIDLLRSRTRVRRELRRRLARGTVPVVTGFFGRGRRGEPVTLGRGGSDYSASAVAALLEAPFVELVKRDASILSADPTIVGAARPVPRLTYAEAEELAEFGARVLHPMTVEPARQAKVEIRVRSLRRPRELTVIGGVGTRASGVRALTASPVVRLVRLRFPGGRRQPGILAELCGRLADVGVPVLQAFTSAAVISLVVGSDRVGTALAVLEPTVAGRGGRLEAPVPVVLIAAVGAGSIRQIGRFPPSILASARGVSATRVSVTLAVPAAGWRSSLRALHRALLEPPSRLRRGPRGGRRPFGPESGRSPRPPRTGGHRSGGRIQS